MNTARFVTVNKKIFKEEMCNLECFLLQNQSCKQMTNSYFLQISVESGVRSALGFFCILE